MCALCLPTSRLVVGSRGATTPARPSTPSRRSTVLGPSTLLGGRLVSSTHRRPVVRPASLLRTEEHRARALPTLEEPGTVRTPLVADPARLRRRGGDRMDLAVARWGARQSSARRN